MIPILYPGTEKEFRTNGIGRLTDCIRCIATEERNGIYEVEFDYPIEGVHFDEIEIGKIVAVTHDDTKEIEPFIIYQRTVPNLSGVVTFNAHHISYKLGEIVAMPFTAGSCAEALQGLTTYSASVNPFTFWTDKTTTASFENTVPRNIRNILGGEENSILDVFGGGDYEFKRFEVKLYAQRGVDSDVEIRYAKNLTDLQETKDYSQSYNAIVPYWADTDGHIVMLPEKVIVYSGLEPVLAYLTDHNLIIIRTETEEPIEVAYTEIKAVPMDLSDQFEEMPTVEQLRAAAEARFERSGAWLPNENLKVDFVQLWQTEEFKEYSALQRVRLCDTVSVYYPQVNINAVKQRVIRTEYNVLMDRYDSIELGTPQTSLGRAIKQEIMQDVPTTSMMASAIEYATNMIRGGLGGYVVMTPGPDGYPQEILIMDTPDVATAVNVWRFNKGGLGHSSNGYEGPYSDIALTQDGRINASIITTGTLNANIIKAGTLSDVNNNTTFNLQTGVLNIKKGSINLGSGAFTVADNGYLTSKSGKIGGYNIDTSRLYYENSSLSRAVELSAYELRTARLYSGELYASRLANGGIVFEEAQGVSDVYSGSDFAEITLAYTGGSTFYPQLNFDTFYSYPDNNWFMLKDPQRSSWPVQFTKNVYCAAQFSTGGSKSRLVKTENYSERLLYCYETPTPLFGDIGEAVLDEEGFCYVDIDDIFSETVADTVEYQVFLQKEGEGDCYIAEKDPRYFVIKGTPNLRVAWELKAKQKDHEIIRLEQAEIQLDEHEGIREDTISSDYIKEQEALLYED